MAGQLKVNGVTLATESSGTVTLENPQIKDSSNNLVLDQSGSKAVLKNVEVVNDSSMMFRNRIINGDMRIDQRNAGSEATITNTIQYTLDRWRPTSQSTTSVMKCQQVTDAPNGFSNSLKMTSLASTSPATSNSYAIFQAIEDKNYTDFAWGTSSAKTVTMSFYVKSSVTGTYSGALGNQPQDRSYPFTYSISSADTWEYKTITIPGDTSGTWTSYIRVWISLGQGVDKLGTAGSWASSGYRGASGEVTWVNTNAATFYITGVQLEVGNQATPFEHRPYGVELSLCQRYYQNVGELNGTYPVRNILSGNLNRIALPQFPVEMRAIPSATYIHLVTGATGELREFSSGTTRTVSLDSNRGKNGGGYVQFTTNLTQPVILVSKFEAEL